MIEFEMQVSEQINGKYKARVFTPPTDSPSAITHAYLTAGDKENLSAEELVSLHAEMMQFASTVGGVLRVKRLKNARLPAGIV